MIYEIVTVMFSDCLFESKALPMGATHDFDFGTRLSERDPIDSLGRDSIGQLSSYGWDTRFYSSLSEPKYREQSGSKATRPGPEGHMSRWRATSVTYASLKAAPSQYSYTIGPGQFSRQMANRCSSSVNANRDTPRSTQRLQPLLRVQFATHENG